MMRGVVQLNLPQAIAASRYLAEVNDSDCDSCGLCESHCHFSAITLGDTAEIEAAKCYGCGLCVEECPNDAISLIPRPDYIQPPENGVELIQQLASARGKIPIVK